MTSQSQTLISNVNTRSVEITIFSTQNIQICSSLRCKQINVSMADQLTATLQNNAAMPPTF